MRKNFEQVSAYTVIIRVQVSNVVAWIVRFFVEVMPKHIEPNVITCEYNALVIFVKVFYLM